MGLSLIGNLEPKKKKRSYVNKELVKITSGHKCKICGRSDKQVGGLEMAHLKAHSKAGNVYIALCPTCHNRYDKGLLNDKERKKVGLTRKQYKKFIPKKNKKKPKSLSLFGNYRPPKLIRWG